MARRAGFTMVGLLVAVTVAAMFLVAGCVFDGTADEGAFRRLSLADYEDKVKGGWFGQMVGVSYGLPSEFKHNDRPITGDLAPWSPELIKRAFTEDDLYVDMTFLHVLEKHGLKVSIEEIGRAFAATAYPLYFANARARDNIRRGIMPPASGGPRYSIHIHDIDFQIECDALGLISPGMGDSATRLADKFGHVMNYGEGVHGGVFVAGMLSAAFFEQDLGRVIEAGLRGVPEESGYARLIRLAVELHRRHPDDWQQAWRELEEAHQACAPFFCWGPIDAKINGAYVVLGLLYGQGDPMVTVEMATRQGKDSDCNPASALGVLGVMMGYEKMRRIFHPDPLPETQFAHTPYTFEGASRATVAMGRQVLHAAGGREVSEEAGIVLLVPRQEVRPVALEEITVEEAAALYREGRMELAQRELAIWDPAIAWRLQGDFGRRWPPRLAGLPPDYRAYGRDLGFLLVPSDNRQPTVLAARISVPDSDRVVMRLEARNLATGSREGEERAVELAVLIGQERIGGGRMVAMPRGQAEWHEFLVDLTPYAGREVPVRIECRSDHGGRHACLIQPVRIETRE